MEILNSIEIEGKLLTPDLVIGTGDESITIKEIFSIEGEVYIAYTNILIPFIYTVTNTDKTVERKRFIMNANHFVLRYINLF